MTDRTIDPSPTQLKTFGRRSGRPLSGRQKELMDRLLPELNVPIADATALNPSTLFSDAEEVWLEIGFGGGEHVSGQARKNPHVGILASEVFFEGIAKLLRQIEDLALKNVRVWPEDGRELVDGLSNQCIDRPEFLKLHLPRAHQYRPGIAAQPG